MNQEVFICEVTQENFAGVVLQNSHKLPVVVEFLGVWSEHCFVVEEIFSKLAKEFAGQFIFAKVDIDEQPELRKVYQVESVPTITVFQNGEIARVDMGQLTEDEARAVLKEFSVFHESDEMREQAREKHLAGDTPAAIMLLTQAIQKHPTNTRVAMDMVQIFIDMGDLANASALFNKLPQVDQGSDAGNALKGRLAFLKLASQTEGHEVLQKKIAQNPDDAQARFDLAVCWVAQYDFTSAMDEMLYLVEHHPDLNDGAPREMMIALISMIKPNDPELAKLYQRKFSSLLT